MTDYIWITTQKEAFHSWPEAPEEVKYLRNTHRHIFHFRVNIETSKDREIEFHMFKRFIEKWIESFPKYMGSTSCEKLADILHGYIINTYTKREIIIDISEDRENGFTKKFEVTQ